MMSWVCSRHRPLLDIDTCRYQRVSERILETRFDDAISGVSQDQDAARIATADLSDVVDRIDEVGVARDVRR
jgi:hypothetical protein